MRRPAIAATKILGLILALAGAGAPAAADEPGHCIGIERVTIFAPRGEVYVDLKAECEPADFGSHATLVAHLEVVVGELPAMGDDVVVVAEDPETRFTLELRGSGFESGEPVLVRLVRFGHTLDVRSLKVP